MPRNVREARDVEDTFGTVYKTTFNSFGQAMTSETASKKAAGLHYGAKIPTKYVPGTTRTLRSVNPVDGSLVKVERNPHFDGGLPGGGDWEPADLRLPSQRPATSQRVAEVTSRDIGKGIAGRAGVGPRLYQGHLHYSDNDRRGMDMPIVGMPPQPKSAGLPTGLPPQMKTRVTPRSAAANFEALTGDLGGSGGGAGAGPGPGGAAAGTGGGATTENKRPGTSSAAAAAAAMGGGGVASPSSSRPATTTSLQQRGGTGTVTAGGRQQSNNKYDDGLGDSASIIARFEMGVPKRASAGQLAREVAGTSRATAANTLRPGSRAGHFVTESREQQFNTYRSARHEGRYDPDVRNADKRDPWTAQMHHIMDDTTLSADAPDWFHVPHTTVCNMTKKQVESLMEYKAPVPTHLVPPSLLSAYNLKPPTPASPRSRPSTTTSAVRGNLGAGSASGRGPHSHYTGAQLAQKMSRATKYTHAAATKTQGLRPRTVTPGGTRRMANTADAAAVSQQFGQPREFESRFGVHGAPMERAAKVMWHERRGQ